MSQTIPLINLQATENTGLIWITLQLAIVVLSQKMP